jgi:hypothetical protein
MAKKLPPLKVYSFRLDESAAEAIKRRARERGLPVALIIRSIIDDYLQDREGDDYLQAFEERLVATIDRLNRTQLQVRRVADIGVAQTEYLRRKIDLLCSKRTPGEDIQEVIAKHRATFMTWLPKALARDGVVRQMIRQVMTAQEPTLPEQNQTNQPDQEQDPNG